MLVAAVSFHRGSPISLATIVGLLASITLLLLGCNLWNDYEDHLRGVDSPEYSGGSGVIQKLWIPAIHIRNFSAVCFLSGLSLGLLLFLQLPFLTVGFHLLWIGLIGIFGALSHSGWPFHLKYYSLGELVIFFLSGPLLTMGISLFFFADPQFLFWFACISLPLSFLAVLRMHLGNMQRIPFDSMGKSNTWAKFLGFHYSQISFYLFSALPFVLVLLMVGLGVLSRSSLLVLVTAPMALYCVLQVNRATGPLDPALHEIRKNVQRFHLSFGLLYCLSFLFL